MQSAKALADENSTLQIKMTLNARGMALAFFWNNATYAWD